VNRPHAREDLLLGPISLDLYRDGTVLPGGGALNMAWHWRQLGVPSRLLTRVGPDYADVALDFLDRHDIEYVRESIVGDGPSATIDIAIQPDGQPYMDRFVEGVWATYRSTPDEEDRIRRARALHVVLVEGAIGELDRLHRAGILDDIEVTADFLGFRHYTIERFARTMTQVDLGFVGWPGDRTDPEVGGIVDVARRLGKRLVVTFGASSILVIDGRTDAPDALVPVVPVDVRGTTVGCGDAFIAYFLSDYRTAGDLVRAAETGKIGGALPTAWRHPLPDEAYARA